MTFLYCADAERGAVWGRLFAARAPDISFSFDPDSVDPRDVRFLAVWEPPAKLHSVYPNLEILFSLGAGVDGLDLNALPPALPVVRMIEPGITEGMAQFVAMSVLALHRHLPNYISCQRRAVWRPRSFKPAAETCVGFLGLGILAKASIDGLRPFGFRLAGWSRSDTEIEGVDCYAGACQLPYFLRQCSILVCLLPLTSETKGILNAKLFAELPHGACLINCGRGGHLDANALLQALESRQLSAAFLDVTDPEPLPRDSPLWAHESVLITPHIASTTRPETAVGVVLANIRRHQQGLPMIGAIERDLGY